MTAKSHCAITYNGVLLDSALKNFQTINIEGRQLSAPKLNIKTVPGRNGDIVLDARYPSKSIKVHFLIQDKNNKMFLEQVKELTHYLQSDADVEFSFADEDGFRIGRVIAVEDPPYDSNIGIGKFIIHCQDPFLYRELRVASLKIPNLKYKKYPIAIEKIELKIKEATSKIILRNITRGFKIILNGDFKKGNKIEATKNHILVNGENCMNVLDFVESDYHQFNLFAKDELSVTQNVDVAIYYRERII